MGEIESNMQPSSNGEKSHDGTLQAEHEVEPSSTDPFAQWKPSKGEWLMIVCFMIVSLVVSLDATILVPILPVGPYR